MMSDPRDFETWLSGSTEDAFKLARSYAADQMRIVQSGSKREDLISAALFPQASPVDLPHFGDG